MYSALFSGEWGDIQSLIPVFTQPGLSLREALHRYFESVLATLYVRLHIREMLELTSQCELEIEKDLRQPHSAMAQLLCQHLGVAQVDHHMHRLVISVMGLAQHLWAHQGIVTALVPPLLCTRATVTQWVARMTEYARAIIMTTTAMGACMMPIALALGGADMSFRSPMAVAVIGRLITSTILSLLVVPAVFTYIDDLGQWVRR